MTDVPAPVPGPPPAASAAPSGPAIDVPVFYQPQVAQLRLAEARRNRTWRIVSAVISLLITAAIWWFFRETLGDLTWWIIVLVLGFPLYGVVWGVVRARIMATDAARAPEGMALGISREGLASGTGWLPWAELGFIRAQPRRFGRSDDLVIQARDGARVVLPLDYLAMVPATLDSVVRALSGGRARVDFSQLDI